MRIASKDVVGRLGRGDGGSSGRGIAAGLGLQAPGRGAGETRRAVEGVEGGEGVQVGGRGCGRGGGVERRRGECGKGT